jgi:oxygen-independent coproporphyrinogen-3 oxidase
MLGLYVHLPFCRVHCAYCPFAISTNIGLQDDYTAALVREIAARASGEAVDTIFFGGGTPSRTSRENLTRVVDALRSSFAIDPDAEFSLEANPEDITSDAIEFWRSLGVNRLSIGVQSFHDAELRPLGRVHGRERALEAIRDAVASGIRTSVDLILGLPNQTAASFRETLDIAIGSGVGHLSLYMLDLEEGTALAKQVAGRRMTLPEDDDVAALYVEAIERLDAAGLRQYEISNFGDVCLHNLRYWRRETYLGFGLAAHSFAGERRFANTRDIARYIAGARESELDESLGPAEQRRETIFLRLRQSSGIEYDDIVSMCGEEGIEWIARGLDDGWLRRDGARVAFTPAGFLLSNDYISQLF